MFVLLPLTSQSSRFFPRAGTKKSQAESRPAEATARTEQQKSSREAAKEGSGRARVANCCSAYVRVPAVSKASGASQQQAWSRSTAARLPHTEAARKGKS